MVKKEINLSSESKFKGKIIDVYLDEVVMESGRKATREVVRHSGASAIVVQNEAGLILLERQYRYPLNEVILEIPAGKLDAGETDLLCAQRELKEETGITAEHWQHLGDVPTTPGFSDEVISLYLAHTLTEGEPSWDEDEYVELEWYSFAEIMEMAQRGEIKDGKTLAALFLAQPFLQ